MTDRSSCSSDAPLIHGQRAHSDAREDTAFKTRRNISPRKCATPKEKSLVARRGKISTAPVTLAICLARTFRAIVPCRSRRNEHRYRIVFRTATIQPSVEPLVSRKLYRGRPPPEETAILLRERRTILRNCETVFGRTSLVSPNSIDGESTRKKKRQNFAQFSWNLFRIFFFFFSCECLECYTRCLNVCLAKVTVIWYSSKNLQSQP